MQEDSPITLEIIEGPEQTADDDGWGHYAYVVELQRDEATMQVPWRQGLGITQDPQAHEVLEALLTDAATIENADGFEDWAAELGFDTDSRKTEALYKQVEEQADRLREFLGEDFDGAVFPAGDTDSEQMAKRLAPVS